MITIITGRDSRRTICILKTTAMWDGDTKTVINKYNKVQHMVHGVLGVRMPSIGEALTDACLVILLGTVGNNINTVAFKETLLSNNSIRGHAPYYAPKIIPLRIRCPK